MKPEHERIRERYLAAPAGQRTEAHVNIETLAKELERLDTALLKVYQLIRRELPKDLNNQNLSYAEFITIQALELDDVAIGNWPAGAHA